MQSFLENSEKLLVQAKDVSRQVGHGDFVASNLGILCKLMDLYKELFTDIAVFKKDDLMAYFRRFSSSDEGNSIVEDYFQFEEMLKSTSCKTVVISFGPQDGALRWKTDTGAIFDVFSDPNRALYRYFQFGWSFFKVWSTEPLSYYGFQMAKGEQLIETYKNVEDDPHQMGGDVILSRSDDGWIVKKVHRSQNSADRPSVREIINCVGITAD